MVKIVTDSAADFEPAELKKLNITCIPMQISFDNETYRENVNLTKDEFYRLLSEKESFEIFGDTIDRTICFADGSDFSAYEKKTVRLRFRMRDAKIFSLKFE